VLHGATGPVPRLTECDAAALPDYALRHGMMAFVPHVLPALADLPIRVREEVESAARNHAVATLRNASDLLKIVRHLTDSGIDLVVLKGAVFSAWLYGDAGLRRVVDVDVLVAESARLNAAKALEQIGFARRIPPGPAEAIYGGIGAWPLERADTLRVDLHWRLAAKRFPMPLTADTVLRHAIPVRFGDRTVNAPAPAHAAVLALLHAAKHVWYALESILSIACLTRRNDIDWTEVHHLARRAGAVRAAAAGLRLAADVFETATPAAFAADVRSAAVERLRALASAALSLPPGMFVDRWLERRTHLAAFDRRSDRIQYDVRRVLEPTGLEWDWLPVPAFAPFYVPLRVVRLVLSGLSAQKRRRAPASKRDDQRQAVNPMSR
jgi:Uncharacterised nucleotidyltransferase